MKGIHELDEAGVLLRRLRIERAAKVHGITRKNPYRKTTKAAQPDDQRTSPVPADLEEAVFIDQHIY